MSKKSKLTAALLITGIPAAALAITLPFLHSKSELSTKEKLGVFNKLKDSTDKATDFLNTHSNIKSDNRLEIENAIKYAKQVGSIKLNSNSRDAKSVVESMLDAKHKLNLLLATVLLKETNEQNESQFNDAIAKSKENIFAHDLLADFNNSVQNFKNKTIDKNTFVAKVVELNNKQREITNNVERDINIFRFTILNKIDDLNIVAKASALNKVVDFIETRLSRYSSRDAINEYQIFFEKASNELYNIESENNTAEVKEIYAKIDQAISKIGELQIENHVREQLVAELSGLKNFVQAIKGNLSFKVISPSSESVSAKKIITDYISTFFDKTAQYFKNPQEVKQDLQNLISEKEKSINSLDPQFRIELQNIINTTKSAISSNIESTKIHELYSNFIRQTSLISVAQTLLKENIKRINETTLDQDTKVHFATELNKQPYSSALVYFEKSNAIMSEVESQNLIKQFIFERLDNLKTQFEFSQANAQNTSLTQEQIQKIQQSIEKINNLKQNNVPLEEFVTEFERLINEERLINKSELKYITSSLEEEFAKESIKPSAQLIKIWADLKPVLVAYTSEFSTATRQELNAQIKPNNSDVTNAIKLLADARLANIVNTINSKNQDLNKLINEKFTDSEISAEKQVILEKVKELEAESQLIYSDKKLSHEEKNQKLNKIKETQEQLEKDLDILVKSAQTKHSAIKILDGYKDNDNAKIYFADDIKKINEYKELIEKALNNPTNNSIDLHTLQKNLKEALDQLVENVESVDGASIANKIESQIKDTFAGQRKANQQFTPVERTLLVGLSNLKDEADANKKITNEVEKANKNRITQNKMDVLRRAIPSLSDFETDLEAAKQEFEQAKKATAELKEEVQGLNEKSKTEFTKITDKLEQENAKITQKIQEYDKLLEDLFKPDKHNKSHIDNINSEIDSLRKQMATNVIKAQLEKESLIMGQSDLDANEFKDVLTQHPYDLVKSDFNVLQKAKTDAIKEAETLEKEAEELKKQKETLDQKIQELWKQRINITDKSQLPKNEEEIHELEKQIAEVNKQLQHKLSEAKTKVETQLTNFDKLQDLAKKVNEAVKALKNIDAQKYPELAKNLQEFIEANRLNASDDAARVNEKLRKLDEAIAKIESSKSAKDSLNELQKVNDNQYKDNNNTAPRKIFEEVDKQIQEVIESESKVISNPDSTLAQINTAKAKIESAISRYKLAKELINNEFEAAKKDFEDKSKELIDIETDGKFVGYKDGNDVQGSEVQKLKAEFDRIIKLDTTTPNEIKELRNKLDLAFNKDKFAHKQQEVQKKIEELKEKVKSSNLEIAGDDGKTPFDKLSELLNVLKADVDSKDKPSDTSDIIKQYEKLGSLENLLEKQEKIINKAKSGNITETVKKNLVDILKDSAPKVESISATHPSNLEIINKTHEINEKFNDAQEFSEISESAKAKINSVKSEIESQLSKPGIDEKAKEEILKLLDEYNSKLEKIQPDNTNPKPAKTEASKIEEQAVAIKNQLENITDFAKIVKNADDLAKPEASGSISEVLKSLKADLAKEVENARKNYTKFDQYESMKDKIKNLTALINEANKVNDQFGNLENALKAITYKPGLDPQDKSSEKHKQFEDFIAKLKEFANDEKVKKDISRIQLLSSVISATKTLLETHKLILEKYDLNEFKFQEHKYGYDWDQKNIGECVLSTVPTVPSTFDPVALTAELKKLQDSALDKKSKADVLYNSRKNVFEKAKSNFDKELEMIKAKNNESIFEELKKDQLIFYKDILTKIQNVQDFDKLSEIDNHSANIDLAHSLTEKFISLAQIVKDLKDKKAEGEKVTSKTSELTAAITKTDQIVADIEKINEQESSKNVYFADLNEFSLQKRLEDAKIHIAKLELLIKHAEAKSKLDSSNLGQEAQKIPAAILARFATAIEQLDSSAEQKIQEIESQYLNGGVLAFEQVFESSKKLQETIKKAKEFDAKSKEAEYYNKESALMKKLYDELDQKIKEAENLLNNENLSSDADLRSKRSTLIEGIENNSYGVISKLKAEKKRETNAIIRELKDIDEYIKTNYNTNKPTINGFENLEVRQKEKEEFADLATIKSVTESINKAKAEITKQKQAIYNFNKNRLTAMNSWFDKYVKLLTAQDFSVNSLNKITENDSTSLLSYIGISTEINAYKAEIEKVTQYLNSSLFKEESYIQDARNMNLHFKNVEDKYKELKEKSSTAFKLIKESITKFNDQVKKDAGNDKLYSLIEKIYKINKGVDSIDSTTLLTRINDVNTKTNELSSVANGNGSSAFDFNDQNYKDNATSVDSSAKTEFSTYHSTIDKLLKGLQSINTLIKGENNSQDDEDSLKGIYTRFIQNRTITNFLNIVASDKFRSDDATQNKAFATFISAYKPLYDSLNQSSKVAADNVLDNVASDIDTKLEVLNGVYKPAVSLLEWFNKQENKQLVFDYLFANDNQNMKDIVPMHNKLYEDFAQLVNNTPNNGALELDITNKPEIMDLFKRFTFLKNTNMPFNTSNVSVYLTRNSTSDKFAPEFVQADTSIKKTKLNFKIKYNKANSDQNYKDVKTFELEFKDVWVTFNTQTTFTVTKDHVNVPLQSNKDLHSNEVFDAYKAGWNNKTFASGFLSTFAATADYKKEKKLQFFREDITFSDEDWEKALDSKIEQPKDLFNWDNKELLKQITDKNDKLSKMDLSTSAPIMKYKMKLKEEDLTFNGKKYKLATFGGKQFMYWSQADTDMAVRNGDIRMWIPYFIYIPLVSEDENSFTILHINYQEILDIPWNDTSFKYKMKMQTPGWSLVKIDKIDDEVTNAANAETMNVTTLSGKELNHIKAHIYAQHMATKYTNKEYLGDGNDNRWDKNGKWKVRRRENSLAKGNLDNNFWDQVDKFGMFIRIREENKEVE
ncbi:Hypothetical protein, predicted transmembrane protein [Mycoplasmopsis bovigenitalium 51080]|uniref:Uncharacterized protein n=1 Tax=Mycoplasmopsis bovigenitalium 51080 TaxID=1188235 RepID=N9TSQ6_9BACT|nr:hypothetical protein [Mycoplasmopsis bovigenitalium]ENY69174.1 Hypothetical protein, predicted transmembrane protein [Mycoplasmopsis bovigenitalium 51080]